MDLQLQLEKKNGESDPKLCSKKDVWAGCGKDIKETRYHSEICQPIFHLCMVSFITQAL